MSKTAVGVIGLGSMGIGVARSLRRAGIETLGCDVRAASVEALRAEGGIGCANPTELGRRAGIVIVLVVNAAQTEQVLFGPDGAVSTLAKGSVVVASSTVAPSYAEDLGKRLAAAGLTMIDAPVSGGAAGAESGALTIMASGAPAAFDACADAFAAIAKKVYRLGDAPGMGSKVKLINQHLAGVHIAAACEAMALGIRAGVDPRTLYEVISNSAGGSWMFQNRMPHVLDGDYSPRSAVNIFVKDLGIVLDSARAMPFPLPIAAAAHQLYLAAGASGLGQEDDAAVIKVFQMLSGIELPKEKA
ncbi:MAG: NAD-binding protein [Rhodospirillales bacterium]|nr:NAD-binding protein [Rhodospirillales bacterium]